MHSDTPTFQIPAVCRVCILSVFPTWKYNKFRNLNPTHSRSFQGAKYLAPKHTSYKQNEQSYNVNQN
jgi:hypothetical protein